MCMAVTGFGFALVMTPLLALILDVKATIASALLYFSPTLAGGEDTVRGRLMAGFVSGSIGSSTSLSGPPIVLYLLGRESDVAAFRATPLLFFPPRDGVPL